MPLDPQLDVPMRSALLLLGLAMGVLLAISASWAVVAERWWSGRPIVPTRPARAVPWGGREALFCFLAWQVVTVIASAILRGRRDESGNLDLVDAMAAVSLVNLTLLVVLPAMLVLSCRAKAADLGFRWETLLSDVATGVVAALCLVPLVYAVQLAAIFVWEPTAHPLQQMLMERPSPAVMVLALVSAVVLAPAAEELMFRGILQGWLEKRLDPARVREELPRVEDPGDLVFLKAPDGGPAVAEVGEDSPAGKRGASAPVGRPRSRAALLLPAALFAGVHFGQWPAPIPLFVLAVGLGIVYRRTGGLVAPIAMHATFNGLSTAAMIALLLLVPSASQDEEAEAIPVPPVPSSSAELEADPVGAEARPD
ncbi:CPBP family intramembrane glutamic endopeptidase [Tautonia sociabilis]|uniref:CPBP family intramembrane metalloprotease n=1 Tax=Tautonia sociabilis TaxID=2080755 RepID=A0A432MI26_9BACT|nr:CPBP family intramembrane glutamic endopeptidase [Tautonia sociabilis]RUL86843.1 CPBP family intramembrane metalloprotease [Tautonia sociabilis]